MPKLYVTYRTTSTVPTPIGIPGFIKVPRAIECPDEQTLMGCAHDLASYKGISNVRINRCGTLSKGTTRYTYQDYQKGEIAL